jgi:hypothetical protein
MFFEASSRELLTEKVLARRLTHRYELTNEIAWKDADDSSRRNRRVAKQLAVDAA